MDIQSISETIIPLLKGHDIRKAGLFGSVSLGKAEEDSDIDILVEAGDNMSLLDFVGIKYELEDALGKPVDLIEYQSIKPRLRKRILSQEIRLYG